MLDMVANVFKEGAEFGWRGCGTPFSGSQGRKQGLIAGMLTKCKSDAPAEATSFSTSIFAPQVRAGDRYGRQASPCLLGDEGKTFVE